MPNLLSMSLAAPLCGFCPARHAWSAAMAKMWTWDPFPPAPPSEWWFSLISRKIQAESAAKCWWISHPNEAQVSQTVCPWSLSTSQQSPGAGSCAPARHARSRTACSGARGQVQRRRRRRCARCCPRRFRRRAKSGTGSPAAACWSCPP